MTLKSLMTAAAVMTLAAAPAFAQTPAAPAAPAAAPAASGYTDVAAHGDIVQTLQNSGQFRTFMKVLDMTNLTGLLKRPQPIAVFAPTDAAFAQMSDFPTLMAPANAAKLQARIVYLIFNGPLDYSKLKGASGPIAGAGGQIYVDGASTPNKVNDANLLQADIKATNGDIYVIDKVIGPGYTPPPAPADEPAAPAAPAAK